MPVGSLQESGLVGRMFSRWCHSGGEMDALIEMAKADLVTPGGIIISHGKDALL